MSVTVESLLDGTKINFPREHAMLCETFRSCLEVSDDDGQAIPVSVKGPVLRKVAKFCAQEAAKSRTAEWDKTFMNVNLQMRYDLIVSANYLDLRPLVDLAIKTVADAIKKLPVPEMKACVGLTEPSWTPEQKAALFADEPWLLSVLPSDETGGRIINTMDAP